MVQKSHNGYIKDWRGLNYDNDAIKAFGVEVVTGLCERLLEQGAPELHFYTLNRSAATLKILHNLGLSAN